MYGKAKIIKNNMDKKDYLTAFYKLRNTSSVSSMYILLHLREYKNLLNNLVLKDISYKFEDEKLDGWIYRLEIKDDGRNFFIEYINENEKSGEEIIDDLVNLSTIVTQQYSIYLYMDMNKLDAELNNEYFINIYEDDVYMTEDYFSYLKEKSRILKEVDEILLNFSESDLERLVFLKNRFIEIKICLSNKEDYIKEVGIYLKNSLELYKGKIFN